MEKSYTSRSIFVLILSAVVVFFIGCCDCKKPVKVVKNYIESEHTFFLDPRQDADSFCDSLKKIFPEKRNIVCTKCACDSLLLVQGLDSVTISGQDGQVVASTKVKPQGGQLPGALSHGRNYFLELPVVRETRFTDKSQLNMLDSLPVINSDKSLLIGVMDTGLDRSVTGSPVVYRSNTTGAPNCYPNDSQGWNFVDNNANTHDNHVNKHGTLVTHLLVKSGIGANVKIMPLKVLDGNKQGSLFHLMCAMAYAEKKGVNIINASLGYYGQKDQVLEKYLDRLKRKNILVVTSAGNQSAADDSTETEIYQTGNVRNLDERTNKFYPACYSAVYDNIISVTTASNRPGLLVSSTQNYSPAFIDLAVIPRNAAASDTDPKFTVRFKDNGATRTEQLRGSSFATPVATGRIIQSILQGTSTVVPPYRKTDLLYPQKQLNGLQSGANPFELMVKNGYYIKE